MGIYGKIMRLTPILSLGVGYPIIFFILARCVQEVIPGMLEVIRYYVTGVVP